MTRMMRSAYYVAIGSFLSWYYIEYFIYFIFAKCQRSALVPALQPLTCQHMDRQQEVSQSVRRVVVIKKQTLLPPTSPTFNLFKSESANPIYLSS